MLYVLGFIVALFVLLRIYDGWKAKRNWKKLEAAREEYLELEKKFGYIKAREHCLHKAIEFGQTGASGVVTVTTKWCKVCKKNLGSAHLKKSLFGNRWE